MKYHLLIMWKRYSLPILSGIFIGTSYIPFLPWAIFFAFVPLWTHWLQAKSAKEIFFAGWLTQFILTLIGFNWIAHTVHEFGNLPWPAAYATLIAFCSIANLHIPIVGLVWFWLFRKQPIALPFLLAAGERLYPMIFDWHLGYTWLWANFPAFHLADVIGFVGLSTITIFLNYFVFRGIRERKYIYAAITILLALNISGYWHSQNLPAPDQHAKILLVQSNVGNDEKAAAKTHSEIRNTIITGFINLTSQALKTNAKPDFAVWPETAYQEVLLNPEMLEPQHQLLKSFLQENQLNLVTGAYGRLRETRQITNSLFALASDGTWAAEPYHKTMLLAFGEYFPGAKYFPRLKVWFPEVGDFGRGQGPTTLQLNQFKIGGQVCYEGLFDWFSRDLANKGAQIIVNVTNDSWYDRWLQPRQHGWMTLARAIEVRRPLVRSTNTGISMVILANGNILERSPLHQEWFHLYEVPYSSTPRPTLFMSWGYWLFPVILALGLLVLIGRNFLSAGNQSSRLDRNS